jgi:hypothetical protein
MLKFLLKILLFILVLLIFLLAGLFLPPTPRASRSLLAANIQKDSLMKNAESPRIIFVGGSNISFGLNSQVIKDSLGLNPVNTGIHAAIGLIYMMDNALQYVKEGDIIILISEYEQFYGDFAYGAEELLRTIFDVNPSNLRLLHFKQVCRIVPYIPNYTMSKFRLKEYFSIKDTPYYSADSFNEYGDVYTHWGAEKVIFEPAVPLSGKFNHSVIEEIRQFQLEIKRKHAVLYVSFPVFQDLSFQNSINQIREIESEYIKNGFPIIGNPERYVFPDSLMFNTPAHLTKPGVDYRTTLFIEDFRRSYSAGK